MKPDGDLTDWGLVAASCVLFVLLLIAFVVLICLSLVGYGRRIREGWTKIPVSKRNPKRIVLVVGLLLVLLNGLFPPFEGQARYEPMLTKYLGHRFLFAPPSTARVYGAIHGKMTYTIHHYSFEGRGLNYDEEVPVSPDQLTHYSAHVVPSLFFIQFATIIGATAGAFFLFGMRDKKTAIQGNGQVPVKTPAEKVSNN